MRQAPRAAENPAPAPSWVVPASMESVQGMRLEAGTAALAEALAIPEAAPAPALPEVHAPAANGQGAVFSQGVLRYVYESSTPLVKCSPSALTDIELGDGEEITQIYVADDARWCIEPVQVASTPHLLVRPLAPGLRSSIAVVTSKRMYCCGLESTGDGGYMPRVGFVFPAGKPQPKPAPAKGGEMLTKCELYAASLPGGPLAGWGLFALFAVAALVKGFKGDPGQGRAPSLAAAHK